MTTPLERLRKNLAQDVEPPTLRLVLTTDLALALAVIEAGLEWEASACMSTDREAAAKLHRTLENVTESTNDGK